MFHFREQTIETTYIQHFFHLEYNLQVHPIHPVQKKVTTQHPNKYDNNQLFI